MNLVVICVIITTCIAIFVPEFDELVATSLAAQDIYFSDYSGQVVLIANVASECGFTEDGYAGLNHLHDLYHRKGLTILAFPCNQFAGQEPGSKSDIHSFIAEKRVGFQVFEKISVNGPRQHSVYKFLKAAGQEFSADIEWNFVYFLINRSGLVVKRFAAGTDLMSEEVRSIIINLLEERPMHDDL